MPLKRISEQKSSTIEEFYINLTEHDNPIDVKTGNVMLSFIEMVNQLFPNTPIFCLTSLSKLILLSENDWKTDWFVGIIGNQDCFYFDYLLPNENRPWKEARVHGEASSLEEAKKYLLIAMRESGGWSENEELKKLLKEKLDS